MPPLGRGKNGSAYWRSLDELADSPEFRRFVEEEFPNFAPELLAGPTRRQFLKVMGASLALAGLTACRWPRETIVPFADRPKNRTPGVPVQYASAVERGGSAIGVLVTSYDGRPIKIDGNELHPFSQGKSDAILQAGVLELYDPDRSQFPSQRANGRFLNRTWEECLAALEPVFAAARAKAGRDLFILSEPSSSPTQAELKRRLLEALPNAKCFDYEPLPRDHEREGTRLAFGRPLRPHLHLDQADVIVSLDADFLADHPAAIRYSRDFTARRRAAAGTLNRLYVVESDYSLTGTMADHRYAVRAQDVPVIATRLATELGAFFWDEGANQPTRVLASPFVQQIAADLRASQGRAVVVAGPRQPPEVHALAHRMNATLGSVGRAVTYTEDPQADAPPHAATIAELCARMRSGLVETLVILGCNPAFDAPPDAGFAESMARVKTAVHLGLYADETAQLCHWHLPRAHWLESWGDARAFDGTVSLVQPLIEPLYDGRTPIELLAWIAGDPVRKGYELVRRTFEPQFGGGDFEAVWRRALHDGVVPGTAWPAVTPEIVGAEKLTEAVGALTGAWQPPAAGRYELVFRADYKIADGRFANNSWLQELPDPISKLTWDNAALLSTADARQLGVEKYGDMIRIEQGGKVLEIAAYPLPGHAAGSITLPVGYGRSAAAGQIARGAGFDVYGLRTTAAPLVASGAQVTGAGRHYRLATTQDHHTIRSRVGDAETVRRVEELVRVVEFSAPGEDPARGEHAAHSPDASAPRPLQLWEGWKYEDGHKWGMAIDLAACTGCSTCVLACQAENNIPVVGKDEVARGREMHWIRVDRYFRSDGSREPGSEGAREQGVEIVHQPMTCVHCENAPCEQVCPVNASVHDSEGLNLQVYNRCIGTRYCNNNCPFKVRRFNWFWNHHGPKHPREGAALTPVEKMVFNPEVTVRSRGVMEKCMFCVQRITMVKIRAKNEGWARIPDGAVTPACAQACPTDAIVFGDLNDPESRVRKLHGHPRSYELLTELNLRARLKYLARIRNRGHEA